MKKYYEEFKNNYEEEYDSWISYLLKWSASQQQRMINYHLKYFFKDKFQQGDLNKIATYIWHDIKSSVEIEEHYKENKEKWNKLQDKKAYNQTSY